MNVIFSREHLKKCLHYFFFQLEIIRKSALTRQKNNFQKSTINFLFKLKYNTCLWWFWININYNMTMSTTFFYGSTCQSAVCRCFVFFMRRAAQTLRKSLCALFRGWIMEQNNYKSVLNKWVWLHTSKPENMDSFTLFSIRILKQIEM